MKAEDFSDAMDVIDSKYVEEAVHYQRGKKSVPWSKMGAVAAACLLLAGAFVTYGLNKQNQQKNDGQVNKGTVPTPSHEFRGLYAIEDPNVLETSPITQQSSQSQPEKHLSEEPVHEKKVITLHADWPYYETLDEMADEADYIVYGKVKSKRCAWKCLKTQGEACMCEEPACEDPTHVCDNSIAVTIYEIEVLESYGKKTPGDKVEFICYGGEIDGVIYEVVCQMPVLEIGGKYALFMTQDGNMLSPIQGIFRLSDNGKFSGGGFYLNFDILDNLKRR